MNRPYWFIELDKPEVDGVIDYPRERFQTKHCAMETAARRNASHKLPFRVMRLEANNTVKFVCSIGKKINMSACSLCKRPTRAPDKICDRHKKQHGLRSYRKHGKTIDGC